MRQRTGRGRRLCLMLLLTAISGAGSLQAQADGAESVLIRDVRLIDREGEVEDVMANILIKKGRLELVTKDRIPSSEADLTLGAEEGVLLGKLELGDPVFRGHHLTASWILSGEMRAYNRRSGVFGPVPVARSVYQGGWGAWELALRWTELDLTDAEIEGGEMQILSAAVNWWLTSYFSFNFYYRQIQLDRLGLQGTSDGMLARVVLMLE